MSDPFAGHEHRIAWAVVSGTSGLRRVRVNAWAVGPLRPAPFVVHRVFRAGTPRSAVAMQDVAWRLAHVRTGRGVACTLAATFEGAVALGAVYVDALLAAGHTPAALHEEPPAAGYTAYEHRKASAEVERHRIAAGIAWPRNWTSEARWGPVEEIEVDDLGRSKA